MEINKVTFESVKGTAGITQSFDDLDINKDGVISETDAAESKDSKLKDAISNLLEAVDEESELSDVAKGDAASALSSLATSVGGSGEASEGKTLTDEEKAKLEALREELKTLTGEIADIKDQISALQKKNEELEATKADYEKQQAEAQEEADKASEKFEEEQQKLDTYTNEYDNYQKELDAVNKEILREQGREEEEYNDSMKNLVNKAVNDYNPAEDGDDFDKYFAQKMSDQGFPTFTKLNDLNYTAQKISGNAQTLLGNIQLQAGIVASAKSASDKANENLSSITAKLNDVISEINNNNSEISGLQSTLATKETRKTEVQKEIDILNPVEGGGMTAAEVLAKVPQKEKDFAKEKGVNLEDCLIMQAADGDWHIYIMSEKDGYYKSVARYYLGYSEESYAMIPCGSGEIYTSQFKELESGGKAAYKISNVNDCWTDGDVCEKSCCYQTCSPLSFDVNGDGVNTKNETVSFDIDGDGKMDTVNNSDEWVLAFDKDGNGKAGENGSELFGDNTDLDGDGKADGYKDGFEALKALAKKEGLIGNGDNKLDADDIKKLSEKYGLTMTNGYGGESKSLADLGITEINLAATDETTLTKNFDGRNNDIMTQEGATFVVNGETRDYADIWNAKKSESEATSSTDDIYKKPDAPIEKVTATIKEHKVNLNLNNHRVIALEGKADFANIKNRATANVEAPDTLLEEIVEIKDEEEIEE